MNQIKNSLGLIENESGAVTVDWVVLTAALVAIAIGVVSIFQPGANSSANQVSQAISSVVSGTLN